MCLYYKISNNEIQRLKEQTNLFKKDGLAKDIRRKKIFKDILPIKVAEEDIHYYKVLSESSKITTPYQGMNIKLNEVIESDKPIAADRYFCGLPYIEINHGIHMFTHKAWAIIETLDNPTYKVYECIIPKGTRYLEGNVDRDVVAEKVILKEIER